MIKFAVLLSYVIITLGFRKPGETFAVNGEDFISFNFEKNSASTVKNSLSYAQGPIIYHYRYFKDKNNEGELTFNYSCHPLSAKHIFTFCNISTRYDICWNLTPVWQGGIMDAISRVLSLGGAGSLDIFHVILLTSYHLSLTLLEETGCKLCSSLHVDINLDADYEAVIGNSGKEFQKFTLHHLRALFSKNQLDVHALSVQKGSIRISFLLKHAAANEDLYLEDRFLHTFQVPNHLKIIMKKKLFHLRIDPTLEDHPRRLFHTLDFLRNEINVKYPSLSYYINRHLFNELQMFSSNKMVETDPDYRKLNIFTHEKPKSDTDFGPSTKPQKSFEHSHSGNLDFKNVRKENPEGTLSRHLLSLSAKSSDMNRKSRTRRSSQTSSDDSNLRSKVRFSFQKPATNTNSEEFQKHLKKQLAKRMRVPLSCIEDLKIKSDILKKELPQALLKPTHIHPKLIRSNLLSRKGDVTWRSSSSYSSDKVTVK
ncbi:hypothetical protein AVEN_267461-1 [Araneus ventricosus]|uniref:Uncharacterized protein n=1 Tax=Araneus ventricosus TaxID=182803 RepID=A0A4Y2F6C5_ARAVE|nr:hypothetical protein AVEN_267461-1 [Araneus ventricosus]